MRAWQAGIRRQRIELLLPLIGATDLDDWPGGIRQQFKAALPMCASSHPHGRSRQALGGQTCSLCIRTQVLNTEHNSFCRSRSGHLFLVQIVSEATGM